MDDFTSLFGPEGTEIDYSRPLAKVKYPLPIPGPKDSLDDALQKMEAIARVVAEGKSAAVFTGDLSATHKGWDAEILSIEAMDHAEKTQYSRWKKGLSLPAIDWKNNVITIPYDEDCISRYKHLAAAVALIWGVPTASPQNASWICSNLPYCKPLIFAVTRLQENERHLKEKMTKLEEYELAESKTIGRVTAVVTDTLNERIGRINQAKDILQARQNALHRKETEWNNAKDPIKHQPQVSSDLRLKPTVAHRVQITPNGEEKKADVKGGVANSLNERLRQINQAKETLKARENAQLKEAEQNGAKDPIKNQPQMSSDPRLRPMVPHCAQVPRGGEERKADVKGDKEEPRGSSDSKRPRIPSDSRDGPPIDSPRGPKRPAQMGRRGGSSLNGSRV